MEIFQLSYHMKTLEFLLILALVGYCFTDTNCESKFEDLLEQKCKAIDSSCSYDRVSQNCFEIRECRYGNEDSATCGRIYPTDLNTYKCSYVGTDCDRVPKVCSDYNTNIKNDTCSALQAPDGDQRCFLEKTTTPRCTAHYNECQKISPKTPTKCSINVPRNKSYICSWDYSDSDCKAVKRKCDDNSAHYEADEDICSSLDISNNIIDYDKKKCIYKDYKCQSKYEKCNEITINSATGTGTAIDCEKFMPLNDDKKDYDYTQICTEDKSATGIKCKAEKRKCTDYNKVNVAIPMDLLNEELCGKLEVSENYQRCAYNETNKECYEEYEECEYYNITNKVETDRNGCESIVLKDKTKKCVYIKEEDRCETRNIYSSYSSCEAYLGNDKKICESIVLPPNNRSYCILDKDKNCIEKSINCSEAYDQEDCLHIAKASENNKRCAYDTSNLKCYEEYIRCEDFIINTTNYYKCNNIKLYNGKTCKYEKIQSINGNDEYRCRSNYKTCNDAETEEECKLIAITGVSDPERKVCDYDDGRTAPKCQENYKYCSDYREKSSTSSATCSNIKPYDESGKEIDIRYKCEYENDVGCQRVPVECEDAGDNPILCDKFSGYIKDNKKKYCLFNGGKCITQFIRCEDYEYSSTIPSCTGNIIKGNIRNVCALDNGKCVTKNYCNLFNYPTSYSTTSPDALSKYYSDLCHSINPNCTFNTNGKCIYEEKDCEGTKFYTDDENNKQICENMEASKPYKKCVLKEDKSGCEEVYRELNYSNAYYSYMMNDTSDSNQNSSDFIPKGINLLIFMLSLLI